MRSNFLLLICVITCCLLSACGDSSGRNDPELLKLASMGEGDLSGYLHDLGERDSITPYLQDEASRDAVTAFFSSIAGSEEVANAILENAVKNSIRPSLAFALAFEESRFQVKAINSNADSVDRGLFQLNSKSFPNLTNSQVYDPETNARYGLAHLRFCLNEGRNDVAALAMYNAGHGRVGRGATPRRTLDYVSHVLAYEKNIVELFEARVASKQKRPLPVIAMGEVKVLKD